MSERNHPIVGSKTHNNVQPEKTQYAPTIGLLAMAFCENFMGFVTERTD
mgnify:CR=1|jgi:hypothetical protein